MSDSALPFSSDEHEIRGAAKLMRQIAGKPAKLSSTRGNLVGPRLDSALGAEYFANTCLRAVLLPSQLILA
jgi:hypothetical protein